MMKIIRGEKEEDKEMCFAMSVQKSTQLKFRQTNMTRSKKEEVLKCIFEMNVRQWKELRLETKKERERKQLHTHTHTHVHMRPHPLKNLGCK